MAPPASPPQSPAQSPARKNTAHKGQGQWALGHLEPLTPNERVKKDDDGLNVRARIENIYAHARLRLDRPGRPARPVALVGPLHPAQARHRRRQDGSPRAARARRRVLHAAGPHRRRPAHHRAAAGHRRDLARVRPRHRRHHRPAEHPAALDPHRGRPRDLGSASRPSACSPPRPAATPRGSILGSPVAGVAADEIIDGTPAIEAIIERFIGSPEFSNLPRKFKTAISGSPHQDVAHEVNDISFVGVEHPELRPRLRRLGRRRPVHQPACSPSGSASGSPLDEVPDVWAGVVGVFRDYGYRRLRTRARLKFLVADWGVERFREVLEKDYLGRTLPDGPAPAARPYGPPRPRRRPPRRATAASTSALAPTVGRVSGTILARLADLAEQHGSRPRAHHPRAEAARARRPRRPRRRAGRPACRRARPARPRPRRSAAARWPAPASSSASSRSSRPRPARATISRRARGPAARLRRAADHQRQRLPQLLRPHPDRRHRLQGQLVTTPTATRSRASRCTSAAASGSTPASAASCAATRSPPTSCPTTSSGSSRAFDEQRDAGRDASPTGWPEPTRRPCDERDDASGALLLPVLRRRGPAARTDAAQRRPGTAARAPASSAVKLVGLVGEDMTAELRRASCPSRSPSPSGSTSTAWRWPAGPRGGSRTRRPRSIIQWAARTFGTRFALTVVDGRRRARRTCRAATRSPASTSLFLDTGYHFAETLGTRDAVAATYRGRSTSCTVEPEPDSSPSRTPTTAGPVREQPRPVLRAAQGLRRSSARCADYDAWAQRPAPRRVVRPVASPRSSTGTRATARSRSTRIARWTRGPGRRLRREHDILVNPLREDGYASIGCFPCTRRGRRRRGRARRALGRHAARRSAESTSSRADGTFLPAHPRRRAVAGSSSSAAARWPPVGHVRSSTPRPRSYVVAPVRLRGPRRLRAGRPRHVAAPRLRSPATSTAPGSCTPRPVTASTRRPRRRRRRRAAASGASVPTTRRDSAAWTPAP